MMQAHISIENVSLTLSNKTCFENFSSNIYPKSHIAIIGRNGVGKSSLIRILYKKLTPDTGVVNIPENLCVGYVEQTINKYNNLSGGQKFNKRLSENLAKSPDILLLDEPTNHLDEDNYKSLKNMLLHYQNILIVVTHDIELLRDCFDIFWHINNGKIYEFKGCYNDYIQQIKLKSSSIEQERFMLKKEKIQTHKSLMKEQKRAAQSKKKGQKNIDAKKWPTIVSKAKAIRAQQTSGSKKMAIGQKKQKIDNRLSALQMPEIILPKFSLKAENINFHNILSISSASIGYIQEFFILKDINLNLSGKERIAITGKNGSGKSTIIKAILNHADVFKTGTWDVPNTKHIGYLDQHYSNLTSEFSVIEHIERIRPEWNNVEVRRHLNDFLFRRNEEVMKKIYNLSGGEKARLSLSIIAAKTPKILILDEISNNLDLETKEHIIQVLQNYPGAIIIISHEKYFLEAIQIDCYYKITDGIFNELTI